MRMHATRAFEKRGEFFTRGGRDGSLEDGFFAVKCYALQWNGNETGNTLLAAVMDVRREK